MIFFTFLEPVLNLQIFFTRRESNYPSKLWTVLVMKMCIDFTEAPTVKQGKSILRSLWLLLLSLGEMIKSVKIGYGMESLKTTQPK